MPVVSCLVLPLLLHPLNMEHNNKLTTIPLSEQISSEFFCSSTKCIWPLVTLLHSVSRKHRARLTADRRQLSSFFLTRNYRAFLFLFFCRPFPNDELQVTNVLRHSEAANQYAGRVIRKLLTLMLMRLLFFSLLFRPVVAYDSTTSNIKKKLRRQ